VSSRGSRGWEAGDLVDYGLVGARMCSPMVQSVSAGDQSFVIFSPAVRLPTLFMSLAHKKVGAG
jgi:hypothetical protein